MTILRLLFKSRTIQFFILAATVAAILILKGIEYDLSKSDWSSWVQAFGSIGAIIGAFLVADRQLVKSREIDALRLADEMVRKSHIISAILLNISKNGFELLDALNTSNDEFLSAYNTAILKHQIGMLQSIPPLDVPTANIVFVITELPQKLSALEICISHGQADAHGSTGMHSFYMNSNDAPKKVSAVIKVALEAMEQCRATIPDLLH